MSNRLYGKKPDADDLDAARPWVWLLLIIGVSIIIMSVAASESLAQNQDFGHQSKIDRSLSYDNVERRATLCASQKHLYVDSCTKPEVERCIAENVAARVKTKQDFQDLVEACENYGKSPEVLGPCKDKALDSVIACIGLPPLKDEDYLGE